jgi:hypothetical protein
MMLPSPAVLRETAASLFEEFVAESSGVKVDKPFGSVVYERQSDYRSLSVIRETKTFVKQTRKSDQQNGYQYNLAPTGNWT